MDHDVTSDPNAGFHFARRQVRGDGRVGEDPVLRIEEGLKATQVEKIDVGDGAGANLPQPLFELNLCDGARNSTNGAGLQDRRSSPLRRTNLGHPTWGRTSCSGVKQGVAIRVFL